MRLLAIRLIICLTCCIGWNTPANSDDPNKPGVLFKDVTERTGIEFQHFDGSDGRHFIIESMSAGLALLDYDDDGDLDIYILNGSAIDDQTPVPNPVPTNRLFRNDGDWRFVDVTRESLTGDAAFGLGVAAADYDNDGDTDLFVNNYGPNALLRNNGDGTFDSISQVLGLADGDRVSTGVAFFDMDSDGDLDLYSANYIEFSPANHKVHLHKGLPSYPSVGSFKADNDKLYENLGDGRFRDISSESGIAGLRGKSMAVAILDFDLDGDSDVFVANDTQENFLFENLGDGTFDEVAGLVGVSHDFRGRAQASMGVEVLDYNVDGKPDLAVTSFSGEFATLYRNDGGIFSDVSARSGVGPPTLAHVTWGLAADDFDGDGIEDLWIGTGGLDDQHASRGGASKSTGFAVNDIFLRGNLSRSKSRKFHHMSSATAMLPATSARGLVAGDLDGDCDPDLVLISARGRARVIENHRTSASLPSVTVQLVDRSGNRDCLGAVVTVRQKNGKVLNRYIRSGRSYQCDSTYQRKSLTVPQGSTITFQRNAREEPEIWVADADFMAYLRSVDSP